MPWSCSCSNSAMSSGRCGTLTGAGENDARPPIEAAHGRLACKQASVQASGQPDRGAHDLSWPLLHPHAGTADLRVRPACDGTIVLSTDQAVGGGLVGDESEDAVTRVRGSFLDLQVQFSGSTIAT
jgi:hypothetical protein